MYNSAKLSISQRKHPANFLGNYSGKQREDPFLNLISSRIFFILVPILSEMKETLETKLLNKDFKRTNSYLYTTIELTTEEKKSFNIHFKLKL